MLKWIGLCFVMLCGTGAGILAATKLRQERVAMERLCQMLRELSVQIEYRASTVQELLEQLQNMPAYAMFCFPRMMLEKMQKGEPFCQAWRFGLQADKTVPESAKQLLLPLGEELGASDLVGQVETLAQYRQQLEPYAAEAGKQCVQRQRLYVSMGMLGGMMLAILLC